MHYGTFHERIALWEAIAHARANADNPVGAESAKQKVAELRELDKNRLACIRCTNELEYLHSVRWGRA